jgi:enterochelin esterase-like enzyme
MKTNLLGALLLTLWSSSLTAQSVVSPEVHGDGRVTFRLKAPDAREVQLHCEDVAKSTMTKDDQGVWSFTTDPLEPDFYVYSFNVDGARVIDPANSLIKYNLLNTDSQVHVPGPASLLWELNDVPHGELHRHFYHSAVANDDRDFIVYTPPGYKSGAWKRYPTLYLLHGFSDDATAWSTVGRANVMVDNLIARKQARPMVIVMPLGYGNTDVLKPGGNHDQTLRRQNLERFQQALLQEVMPQVEKSYRVSHDRDRRAIAGLSMGGNESLMTGLNHPDQFAWIGSFSAGGINTNFPEAFPNVNSATNDKLRLLWIGCGNHDPLVTVNRQFCDWLTAQNVRYTWVELPGVHSFLVWRRDLCQFAPLLFQNGQ